MVVKYLDKIRPAATYVAVATHYVDIVAQCIVMVFVLHNLHSNKMIIYILSEVCFIDSAILVLEKYTF